MLAAAGLRMVGKEDFRALSEMLVTGVNTKLNATA